MEKTRTSQEQQDTFMKGLQAIVGGVASREIVSVETLPMCYPESLQTVPRISRLRRAFERIVAPANFTDDQGSNSDRVNEVRQAYANDSPAEQPSDHQD